MPDPLTVGRRAAARLEEAILLALEEYRDQGYISTIRLAERIGWDAIARWPGLRTSRGDRRQLVLPVTTTIFAGRDGVIIRYGGTVDYRPTNQAIEAETYGRQDTGNGSGQGWDERAFSAQVAERAIAVAGETGASVAHSARPLRRGVGG